MYGRGHGMATNSSSSRSSDLSVKWSIISPAPIGALFLQYILGKQPSKCAKIGHNRQAKQHKQRASPAVACAMMAQWGSAHWRPCVFRRPISQFAVFVVFVVPPTSSLFYRYIYLISTSSDRS
mmetsp:Transcript_39073/g.80003  ORF Transcript_39073/g.80003 Transcript_39073/m.80003 type:complete len:123 (-) Transcript_39073:99-467(-)